MVSTDPIADMLTRIRNAIAVNKNEVTLPYSKMKFTIAEQLKNNDFISEVSVDDSSAKKVLKIVINNPEENPRINSIQRVSKPGRRMYTKVADIPKVKNGRGIVLMSTSKGIMTGTEAATNRLGGEIICKVY